MSGTESRDLDTSVAIENCEQENVFAHSIEDHGVLHVFPPSWVKIRCTLHFRSDDSDFAMLVDVSIFGGDRL